MRGFLYFLPHARQSDMPGNLSQWGLSHLVDDDTTIHSRQAIRGPGASQDPGFVIGSSANFEPEQVKHDPEKITWQKFPQVWPRAKGRAEPWIGWYEQHQPGEGDLRRTNQISGQRLKSADGQSWLIPHARVITEDGPRANLPLSFTLDDETGDWVAGQVLPRYRELWKHANACLEAMIQAADEAAREGKEQWGWTIPDHRPLIEEAFKVNYRVSEMELAVLGLLVTGVAGEVAQIITDASGWERIKKKEAVDTGAG